MKTRVSGCDSGQEADVPRVEPVTHWLAFRPVLSLREWRSSSRRGHSLVRRIRDADLGKAREGEPSSQVTQAPGEDGVRQVPRRDTATATSRTSLSWLAHPSARLLIQINSEWRVVDGDRQSILERRIEPKSRGTGRDAHGETGDSTSVSAGGSQQGGS